MFIRRVAKTNGKNKKKYTYLHLVESVRTENGPRQKLLLNLGDLAVDPSQYKALARRIEDILTGRKSLFEINPEIDHYVKWAANKIFTKRANQINTESVEDFQMIDSKSIEVSTPSSLSAEYVCHSMWQQLDFNTVLRR